MAGVVELVANVLRDNVSRDTLIAAFSSPRRPLLPPAGDAAWARVRANPQLAAWRTAICDRATADAAIAIPELTDAAYRDFKQTGQRLAFERPYFERRRRVGRAVLAVVLDEAAAPYGPRLRHALSELEALIAEDAWALPAHVSDTSGKDPMEIDLFGGETANLFGEAIDLLGPGIPDAMVKAVDARLGREFFSNYLSRDFWWYQNRGNCNAVCHQGVLGAALARLDDTAQLADLFHAAAPRLITFLNGFADDGSTSEGPAYWTYGFGRFMEPNRQLERRTNGALSLVEGDPHAAAIARFGPAVSLSGGLCVNFADCAAERAIPPALLTALSDRFADPAIGDRAAAEWARLAGQTPSLDAMRDDLFHLTRQLLATPTLIPAVAPEKESDVLLAGIGVVISRFRDRAGHWWEYAVKAGHNDELHNHNDVGSYLLNIDGRRCLIEIGAPEYTRAFFGPQRYEFFAASSLGHPVPRINGTEQAAGLAFAGTIVSHTFSPDAVTVIIDLTSAYPTDAGCRRCLRRIDLDKRGGRLRVRDDIELSAESNRLESPLIVETDAVECDGHVRIDAGVRLQVMPATGTCLGGVDTHTYRAHGGEPASVRRIVMLPCVAADRLGIGYDVFIAPDTDTIARP